MKVRTLKIDRFSIPPMGPFEDLAQADRELVDLDAIHIPDVWHVVQYYKERDPRGALAIYQAWIIAHDLLKVLRDVDAMRGVFDQGANAPHCTNTIPTEGVNDD